MTGRAASPSYNESWNFNESRNKSRIYFLFFFSPLCWLFRVGLDLSSKTRYDGYKLFTVTGAGAADGALDVLR